MQQKKFGTVSGGNRMQKRNMLEKYFKNYKYIHTFKRVFEQIYLPLF